MIGFLLAVQFLTIFPLRINSATDKDLAKSTKYFPLVGLLLGLFLIGINKSLAILNFSQVSINIILVVALVVITGGLHLDGLSDTADAFLSGKPKEEMLRIMRDSHVGAMGALSLISIILVEIALISSVSSSIKISALILMCVLSRWAAVLLMFLFPYAREEGKAKVFIREMNLRIFIVATLFALICAFLAWQLKGLILALMIAAFAYLFGRLITKRISGITGDTLGAAIELTEVVTLFCVCILERSNLWIM